MKLKVLAGAALVLGLAAVAASFAYYATMPAVAQDAGSEEAEPLIKAAPAGLAQLPNAAPANPLPRDIVVMNPDGDVTVVEFFDYFCHVCQRISKEVQEIAKEDGNIRLIFREFPILNGENSVVMSRLALAAYKQGIYIDVHNAFLDTHGRIDVNRAVEIIENLGGDIDQLQKDVNQPDIMQSLQFNVGLGFDNELRATPSFMIEGNAMQGYPGRENLISMVQQIREQRAAQTGS